MHKFPAFQWYPKQWLGDDKVLAMDWDARGMHFWLINISWQQEPPGSIADDMAQIRRWLGLPSGSEPDRVWARVRPQIFAAWSLSDGRWYQPGTFASYERLVRRSKANSENVRIRYERSTNSMKAERVVDVELDCSQIQLTPVEVSEISVVKRACRLAEDWEPTTELTAWAEHTYPNLNHRFESEKFRNYWLAKGGVNATKLDWGRTWRNWIMTAAERSNGHGRKESNDEALRRIARAVADADDV